MNDWLSLPSGEMVRVSEIAATAARYAYSANGVRLSESTLILKDGHEVKTPYNVVDLNRLIRDIEKKQEATK